MSKDIFDEVEQEGQQVEEMSDEQLEETVDETDTEETEDSPDSSTEKNQKEKDPSHQGEDDSEKETKEKSEEKKEESSTDDETNVPFHKHPRWIQREERLNSLEETNKTLRETNEQLLDKFSERTEQKQDETIPQFFQNMFGDDPAAWSEFRKYTTVDQKSIVEQAKTEIRKEMEEVQTKQTEQTKKYDDWVEGQIQDLKDSGEKFDEKALKETALEYLPTDAQGNISFTKALKILRNDEAQTRSTNDEKKEEKKKIASKTSSKSSGDSEKEELNTTQSLRTKSWNSLAEPED